MEYDVPTRVLPSGVVVSFNKHYLVIFPKKILLIHDLEEDLIRYGLIKKIRS